MLRRAGDGAACRAFSENWREMPLKAEGGCGQLLGSPEREPATRAPDGLPRACKQLYLCQYNPVPLEAAIRYPGEPFHRSRSTFPFAEGRKRRDIAFFKQNAARPRGNIFNPHLVGEMSPSAAGRYPAQSGVALTWQHIAYVLRKAGVMRAASTSTNKNIARKHPDEELPRDCHMARYHQCISRYAQVMYSPIQSSSSPNDTEPNARRPL